MAKAKKVEKRSAPKKAATKQAERIMKKLDRVGDALKRSFEKPDPEPRKKAKRLVKMTKPELIEESNRQKAPVLRGVKFETRQTGRIPVPKPVPKNKPDPDGYAKLAHMIMHDTPRVEIPPPVKPQPPSKASARRLEARYPERVPEKPPEPEAPKIEISVRNVYYDGQYLPALCFRKPGALHVPCVAGDSVNGVRKFTIQAVQHDKSTILQHGYGNFAAEYSPERFASHMRRIAGAAPITPEARSMLLPYCPDMPTGPALPDPVGLECDEDDDSATLGASPSGPGSQPVRARTQPGNGSRAPSGPARTSGKELIRTLADAAKLPPEKVRAKLRAAGMRAPYTSEPDCRKALGLKA